MARRSILVIDDEIIWHRLLTRLLAGPDYIVYAAATCAEGVRLAELHKPDCIVLDFHLKDGDAVSVCSALKTGKSSSKIPVIIFSSDPGAEIAAYAECRASRFVLKGPHAMAELSTIVKKILLNYEVAPYVKEPRIEPSI